MIGKIKHILRAKDQVALLAERFSLNHANSLNCQSYSTIRKSWTLLRCKHYCDPYSGNYCRMLNGSETGDGYAVRRGLIYTSQERWNDLTARLKSVFFGPVGTK